MVLAAGNFFFEVILLMVSNIANLKLGSNLCQNAELKKMLLENFFNYVIKVKPFNSFNFEKRSLRYFDKKKLN